MEKDLVNKGLGLDELLCLLLLWLMTPDWKMLPHLLLILMNFYYSHERSGWKHMNAHFLLQNS